MKTSNKLSLILAATCLILVASASSSFAQGRFSVGGNLGLPMGSFSDYYSFGIGVSGAYEGNISDKLNWTATVGVLSFSGKTIGTFSVPSGTLIPILGGVKYYVNEMFNGFYVSGQLGFTNSSTNYGGVTYSSTDFSFAPGVGYHLTNIDISAAYNVISESGGSTDYLGARVAYVFGGK